MKDHKAAWRSSQYEDIVTILTEEDLVPIKSSHADPILKNRWIVSAEFDLAIFGFPLIAALLVLPIVAATNLNGTWEDVLFAKGTMPLWAFISIIITFDVAHVWATAYRVYMDVDEWNRRFWLYTLPIPVSFLLSFCTHWYNPTLFWTILAYMAVWHFIKQPYGFVALYKSRYNETSWFDFHFDRWVVWCGGLGPTLLWHSSPRRVFDWFNASESFLFKFPPNAIWLFLFLYVATGLLFVARSWYLWRTRNYLNLGKTLVIAETWITWAVGVGCGNAVISAAFLNLFHGVPFFAITWVYCNNKYQTHEQMQENSKRESAAHQQGLPAKLKKVMKWISRKENWMYFFGLAMIPALIEETLWDVQVWHQYLPNTGSFDYTTMGTPWVSFWVAVLSIPQIVHYFLDNFLWRFDGSNPDLKTHLGLD